MRDDGFEQFNRLMIIVAAIFVAFAALLVVVIAWGASAESIGRIEDFAGFLRRHDHNEEKLVVTLGAIVFVLLMLIVIIIEVTPSPMQTMRIRNMKSGAGVITTTQIAERINAEVAQVPHVASCSATVAARNKKLEVALDLYVDQAANLAETADAACRRAQLLVEGHFGIELAKRPSARLHYRELRLRDKTSAGAAAALLKRDQSDTGWERPGERSSATAEEERDERGRTEAPEEAQA